MNYSELLQLAKGWGNFISDRIIIWRLHNKKRIRSLACSLVSFLFCFSFFFWPERLWEAPFATTLTRLVGLTVSQCKVEIKLIVFIPLNRTANGASYNLPDWRNIIFFNWLLFLFVSLFFVSLSANKFFPSCSDPHLKSS